MSIASARRHLCDRKLHIVGMRFHESLVFWEEMKLTRVMTSGDVLLWFRGSRLFADDCRQFIIALEMASSYQCKLIRCGFGSNALGPLESLRMLSSVSHVSA